MKLEDGNTYIDGRGRHITITIRDWKNYPFPALGDNGQSYTAEGKFEQSGASSPFDLVAVAI